MFFAFNYLARKHYINTRVSTTKAPAGTFNEQHVSMPAGLSSSGAYGHTYYLNFTDRVIGVLTSDKEMVWLYPEPVKEGYERYANHCVVVRRKDRRPDISRYDFCTTRSNGNIGVRVDAVPAHVIDSVPTGYYLDSCNIVIGFKDSIEVNKIEIEDLVPDAALLSQNTYGINFTVLSRSVGPTYMVIGEKVISINHTGHDGDCKVVWQERYTPDNERFMDNTNPESTSPLLYKEISLSEAFDKGINGIRFYRTADEALTHVEFLTSAKGKLEELQTELDKVRDANVKGNGMYNDLRTEYRTIKAALDSSKEELRVSKLEHRNIQAKNKAEVKKANYGFFGTILGICSTIATLVFKFLF